MTTAYPWYAKNRERVIASAQRWQKDNPVLAKATAARYKNQARLDIVSLLGGKCRRCGFDDVRALQIDHVHGGGRQERRELGEKYYRAVRARVEKGDENYQILCANCNAIKRFENPSEHGGKR